MPILDYKLISKYPIELIYQMIVDVEKYPEFLPWCQAAKILEKKRNYFIADLLITFKIISESYCSRVDLKSPKNGKAEINVSLISGPFKKLQNNWKLRKIRKNQTEIEFYIDFEFKSSLLDKLISLMFYKACERMLNAFEARANTLFDKFDGSENIAGSRRRIKKA
jgi:coenzyme Q-binding protein COQ10